MRDPVFFATPKVFEQPESDDRLEPENDFLFLVDTGVAKKTGMRISDVSLGPRGATPLMFEQPESDDRLEPENDFLFLVDTGVAKKTGSRTSDVSLGPRGAISIRLETQYDHLPQLPQI